MPTAPINDTTIAPWIMDAVNGTLKTTVLICRISNTNCPQGKDPSSKTPEGLRVYVDALNLATGAPVEATPFDNLPEIATPVTILPLIIISVRPP